MLMPLGTLLKYQSAPKNFKWPTKITDNSGPSSSSTSTLKSSGFPLPGSSSKTSESPEAKSITPDKEYDVNMKDSGDMGGGGGLRDPKEVDVFRAMKKPANGAYSGGCDVDRADDGKSEDGTNGHGEVRGDSKCHRSGHDATYSEQKFKNSSDKRCVGDNLAATGSMDELDLHSGIKERGKKSKLVVPTTPNAPVEPSTTHSNYPLLIGTLSYSEQEGARRQHQIRGNWKYENNTESIPLRFELLRTIPPDENLRELPKDGEFHGTFSLTYEVKTSKGKVKVKRKNINESGVKIVFTKVNGEPGVFAVKGVGVNEYGAFELVGTATKSTMEDDPGYHVRLHKIYAETTIISQTESSSNSKQTNNESTSSVAAESREEELPPPTELISTEVVCLRGKLSRNTSENLALGLGDVVHKISGVWAIGLKPILDDPDNSQKLCEKFEYEHKCSGESTVFPLSGKYTGWFYVNNEGSPRTKISERDITLKFIENSEGYHNVEGKGSNVFGKYTISGTLSVDGTITIFRNFSAIQTPKIKLSKKSVAESLSTPAPGPLNGISHRKSSKKVEFSELLQISFDDVEAPDGSEPVPESRPPTQGINAVSKGTFKIGEDGTHTCAGDWAMRLEDLSGGITSSYHFGILQDNAAADAKAMLKRMESSGAIKYDDRRDSARSGPLNQTVFPIDSARYKGSFKMRKGGTKTSTIKDDQIVLKFVKNTSDSYNVYGKGINSMGAYDIVGTLIPMTKSSGQLFLYRLYSIGEADPNCNMQISSADKSKGKVVFPGSLTEKAAAGGPMPSMNPPEKFTLSACSLQRRESGRQIKLPSKLEEADPKAQRAAAMEKCRQILKDMQVKDTSNIFAFPVDPIAHDVPTYFDVIKDPMDLGTIRARMDDGQLDSPEEFIRLVRLVFDNAFTFNTLPDSLVRISARELLSFFNSKIRAVERVLDGTQANKKLSKAELKDLKRKEDKKKRKHSDEAGNEPKRKRLNDYIEESRELLYSISQASKQAQGDQVSRTEFNLLLQTIQLLHEHTVAVHQLISNSGSSKGDRTAKKNSTSAGSLNASNDIHDDFYKSTTPPKKKKPKTNKYEREKAQLTPSFSPEQSPIVDLQPLTEDEQEALSENINQLPEALLPGAMQIIREADMVNADDDEIDLEIDQLDIRTQRKLLRYINENVKPKRKRELKKMSTSKASSIEASPTPPPAPSPDYEDNSNTQSSLTLGTSLFPPEQDDSDSDEEPDVTKYSGAPKPTRARAADPYADHFLDEDDAEDDDDDDLKVDDIAANWLANSTQTAVAEDEDDQDSDNDDGLWSAAKKEAVASKALEADRKKREEEKIAHANTATQKKMEEAQAMGEEIRSKREEEAANEARRLEERKREAEEARVAAMEQALKEVNDVKNTIDLDAQRDLMRQWEQELVDHCSPGASPSSDFGF